MGARGGRGPPPPIFLIFFFQLFYYFFLLLFTHDHEYGSPLLAFVSFCMLGLCFYGMIMNMAPHY